jgi:hypothetical protein
MFSGMRRMLALVAVFAVSVGAMADDGVILKLKNGSEVGFVFTSKPKIATGAELSITTADGTSVRYNYADVRSVTFGDVTSTGIDDVAASPACDVVFRLLDGKVMVDGLPAGESVSVYSVSGQLLTSQKQTANGASLTLPLEGNGVLIIRTTTGVSYKVMKKYDIAFLLYFQ